MLTVILYFFVPKYIVQYSAIVTLKKQLVLLIVRIKWLFNIHLKIIRYHATIIDIRIKE